MSTQLIPFDPSKLATALRQVSREAAPMASFLKMDKTGVWVFGIETEELEDGAEFYVNPAGFQHGYICWAEAGSEKLGELIAPITDVLPDSGPVPGGGRGWEFQLGMHLRGTGKDSTTMIYRSSSVGGKRAIATVADMISRRLNEDSKEMVPVVTLDSDSYKHKQYGKIFVPVIEIVRWVSMPKLQDAEAAAQKNAKQQPPAKVVPKKKRR